MLIQKYIIHGQVIMTDETVFDTLVKLKDDPEAFDRERQRLLEETISSFPEEKQQRARSMQWKLEQDLDKFKDPVARYNQIIKMFYAQLSIFQDSLNGLLTGQSPQVTDKAPVLEFKKKNS